MIERKMFAVVEMSSRHCTYDLSPQTGTNIYGLYDDMDSAKKGFKNCLDIARIHYNEAYGHEEVDSVLIEEENYALIIKVTTRREDKDPTSLLRGLKHTLFLFFLTYLYF